jgi:zinc transport system permease protein
MIASSAAWEWWSESGLPAVHDFLRGVLPFEWAKYGFALNALIECVLLAPLCAAMGVKIVNFRLAFFSDAIAHSAFTGVALGFLIDEWLARSEGSFDPRISLIGFGLLVAVGIALVRRRTDLSNDTVVGVFFSTVVALGLAIVTVSGRRTADFQRYLVGDILTLDAADIGLTALLALLVFGFLLIGFTPLTLMGVNAELAHSRGVRVRLYDYLFGLLLALVVTVSIRTAGILLATGMLIVPAAAARNLARSAGGMFRWAIAVSWLAAVGGTAASFSPRLQNISTGAVIVLASAFLFAVSLIGRRR